MGRYHGQHQPGEEQRLLGNGNDQNAQQSPRRWTAVLLSLLGILVLSTVYLIGHRHQPAVLLHSVESGGTLTSFSTPQRDCNSIDSGYQCGRDISRHWGQYSPYFSLASESSISDDVPENCRVTFVQALSRHGARYPTETKSKRYAALVASIQANATAFYGKYAFLRSYRYTMGGNDLTIFGQRQMLNSGIKFYRRYGELANHTVPFIRASGSDRVVASGETFIEGFEEAKRQDKDADQQQPNPKIDVIITEGSSSNNSLNHNSCPRFEEDELGDKVKESYTAIFAPPIRHRLERDIPGVRLSDQDIVSLMDICPFDTVSRTPDGSEQSPFCDLFTEAEWAQYNYLQSLGKYYGYGAGNILGPAQGIGFVNELVARLTHTSVHDDTSTNHTLNANASFPINRTLYADFTHDNGLTPIFFALGLYNGTAPLSRTHVCSPAEEDGYSATWTVPFAARAYIEMMQCRSESGAADLDPEPLVRVLVNDRVVPLHGCPADSLGRCRRNDFVHGLSFARSGGNWRSCYEKQS
ncbi:hypothetical protein NUU61_005362 [Penicillium alfredii]|uniref:Phytase A n=1 Tax=Penicillium alfredii TaxID=1506179 RepID=A0A9W9F9C0_9EURO|nr:uncharacterized protein NUU61_005362 [Penicillium alfredii]KAJ5096006.1 hypothetical protein NUU61_005362 [Penicillium alfredii]